MNLLSIFHTGGLTLGLTLVWLIIAGVLMAQVLKYHKQEFGRYDKDGKWIHIADHTPITAIKLFWLAVAVTIIYGVALLFVASDYKGV